MHAQRSLGPIAIALAVIPAGVRATDPSSLFVNASRGDDAATGSRERPLRSLSAAIVRLPEPVTQPVTIRVAVGRLTTTGGAGMPENRLDLARRMRPGVTVTIVGDGGSAEQPILAWEGADAVVSATEGNWRLSNLQVGSGSTRQRRGVMVSGPARVELRGVTFRTRSHSDAAVYAHRGGRAVLNGAIEVNAEFHDAIPEGDTFSGLIATDHGSIAFGERTGSTLNMGNGSLSASYYGTIELNCDQARITSWGEQSNCIAVNNSGRVDLHGTPTRLCAKRRANTPIGLEHDGHVLAEGARITIEGSNDDAIVLQKASTLFCNDVELYGRFRRAAWVMSGSTLLVGLIGNIGAIEADTGAHVTVERVEGKLEGTVTARRCGSVALPDRNVTSR
jgi:hypothetical protein